MKALNIPVDFDTLSHELRIPLTGILGMSELLHDEDSLSEEQKKQIDLIHEAGNRLLAFVEKILNSPRKEVDSSSLSQLLLILKKKHKTSAKHIRVTI